MVETTPVAEVKSTWRATAGWLLLGALGCSVGTLAAAAGEVKLSATISVCPPSICGPDIKAMPNPGPDHVIAPGEAPYGVLGTRVRPDEKAPPGRFGVEFDVCVSNASRDLTATVTQVLVVASVQPDAGVAPQLRSYLVKLPQPLKSGEVGCARGAITTPFRRPLVFVAHPAN